MNILLTKEQGNELMSNITVRVNKYIKENSRYAPKSAKIDAAAWVILFLTFYIISSFFIETLWIRIIFSGALGFVSAQIGFIAHEMSHLTFFPSASKNKKWANLFRLDGSTPENWDAQHNKQHHPDTNVHGLDPDIDTGGLLRQEPYDKWRKHHKILQFWPILFFLYGQQSLAWILVTDFFKFEGYVKKGLIKKNVRKERLKLWSTKTLYVIFMIVLPACVTGIVDTLISFYAMHFVLGLTLSFTFVPAHVRSDVEFFTKEEKEQMSHVKLQIRTTANFGGPKLSKWVKALNFQVPHHLFPKIHSYHLTKNKKHSV